MKELKNNIVPLAWIWFGVMLISLTLSNYNAVLPVKFEFNSNPSRQEHITTWIPGQSITSYGYFDRNSAVFEIPVSARSFTVNNFDPETVTAIEINGHKASFSDFVTKFQAAKTSYRLGLLLKAVVLGVICAALVYFIVFKRHYKSAVVYGHIFRKHMLKFDHNRLLMFLILVIFSLVILYFRRPVQFLNPYPLTEDATVILNDYLINGWGSLAQTVNGYYILSSKLINLISYEISFWHYPAIASALTQMFIIAVICAIAFAPTHLKAPYWCAVMTLLVKTGAECFGTPLYSFWWAGLLLVLVVIWRNNAKPWLRIGLLLFGGFSSPLIVVATPLLIALAIYKRNRNDIICAAVSLIPCIIQAYAIINYVPDTPVPPLVISGENLIYVIRAFFGSFVVLTEYNNRWLLFYGIVLIVITIGWGIKWRCHGLKAFIDNNLFFLLLLVWLAAAIASSVTRYPEMFSMDMHPFFSVHRYLFYPFIILTWLTIWMICKLKNNSYKLAIKMFLILILVNFIVEGAWHGMMGPSTTKYNWYEQLALALQSPEPYPLPTHSGGQHTREYALRSLDVQKLIEQSWFYSNVEENLHNLGK